MQLMNKQIDFIKRLGAVLKPKASEPFSIPALRASAQAGVVPLACMLNCFDVRWWVHRVSKEVRFKNWLGFLDQRISDESHIFEQEGVFGFDFCKNRTSPASLCLQLIEFMPLDEQSGQVWFDRCYVSSCVGGVCVYRNFVRESLESELVDGLDGIFKIPEWRRVQFFAEKAGFDTVITRRRTLNDVYDMQNDKMGEKKFGFDNDQALQTLSKFIESHFIGSKEEDFEPCLQEVIAVKG
jgi:hypothetical protein